MPMKAVVHGQRQGRKHRDQAYAMKRATTPALRDAQAIRNTARWQRFRESFRAHNPLCCDPFKEHGARIVPMQDVHHVKPLHEAPELAFVDDNCRALCRWCHNRIEALERQGKPTEQLFATS